MRIADMSYQSKNDQTEFRLHTPFKLKEDDHQHFFFFSKFSIVLLIKCYIIHNKDQLF